jgi:hypothetical protein
MSQECQQRSLPPFAERDLWNIPLGTTERSLRLDVRRFDDRPPKRVALLRELVPARQSPAIETRP